jgi:WD40 repeat protein
MATDSARFSPLIAMANPSVRSATTAASSTRAVSPSIEAKGCCFSTAFGHDERFFLASGIGPNGGGDNTIVVFDSSEVARPVRLVSDPELSPLDLAIAPNGNIVVSSEHPFGAPDAVTSVREYDARSGHLVRVFSPDKAAELRRPRGLRFGPDGQLYCVAQNEVVSFDSNSGKCLGTAVRFPRLHGQALAFFP